MKEVVKNKELKEIIINAIDLLCNTVASTLGPTGNNIIISSNLTPYITNDGVTIARNIESNDKKINAILEIIKEASLKTDEKVGDGTTTTLVLLASIFKEGLKELENINAIALKKELNNSLEIIINEINNLKIKPTSKDLISISSVSSGSEEIGKLIYEVYQKVNNKYAIKIEESSSEKTYYEIKKGYSLEIENILSTYFNDKNEIVLNDTYILLLKGYLDDLEKISEIINEGLERNKNIIILAEDYLESIKNDILSYSIRNKKNIYIFKMPEYGLRKEEVLNDLVALTNAEIKDISYDSISFNNMGLLDKAVIKKEELILMNNSKINDRITKLKKDLDNCIDDYEKEFIENRLSKFENGIATIYVGGITKTDKKEKIMHFEDGICALNSAKDGILIGEGITLLKISSKLKDNTCGNRIMKKVLQVSFDTIIDNLGLEIDKLKEEIIKSNYKKIYNYKTNSLEDVSETKILDPVSVVIETIKNAVSISSLLLTTNYLVINEEELTINNTL